MGSYGAEIAESLPSGILYEFSYLTSPEVRSDGQLSFGRGDLSITVRRIVSLNFPVS